MKHLLTSILCLLSIICHAQFGLNLGVNLSSYTGGSAPYTGIKHTIGTPKLGVYDKFWLNKKMFIQAEIDFLMMGAKNPTEFPEDFRTYHMHLPVVVGVQAGAFSFQAGLYANKMLKAENYTWFGVNTFSWDPNGWKYLDHENFGGTLGIGYDFIGMEMQVSYIHDFNKTQNVAWDYNVKKLGYNHALSISAYIPLFYVKRRNTTTN